MDTEKMRACAPLLPEPGGAVVLECLDEIDALKQHVKELLYALEGLYAMVEGECPSLLEDNHQDEKIRSAILKAVARLALMQSDSGEGTGEVQPHAESPDGTDTDRSSIETELLTALEMCLDFCQGQAGSYPHDCVVAASAAIDRAKGSR